MFFEKNHQFLRKENKYYRSNEIWRNKILKFQSGKILETEKMIENFAEVKYIPEVFNA
jgi:vancomycin resistance protein VanW